jgi:hypothetical protein
MTRSGCQCEDAGRWPKRFRQRVGARMARAALLSDQRFATSPRVSFRSTGCVGCLWAAFPLWQAKTRGGLSNAPCEDSLLPR